METEYKVEMRVTLLNQERSNENYVETIGTYKTRDAALNTVSNLIVSNLIDEKTWKDGQVIYNICTSDSSGFIQTCRTHEELTEFFVSCHPVRD
jgi:hypothetical protein